MAMTTTERAAQIRADLKRVGVSSRQVSVRADYYSMGSSINITIKDATVSKSIVKAAAERHEVIHRCEITGEILSGCNRYVSVRYTDAALAALGAPYLDDVNAAVAKLQSDSDLRPVGAMRNCLVGRERQMGNNLVLYGAEGFMGAFYDAKSLATAIGVAALDGAVSAGR